MKKKTCIYSSFAAFLILTILLIIFVPDYSYNGTPSPPINEAFCYFDHSELTDSVFTTSVANPTTFTTCRDLCNHSNLCFGFMTDKINTTHFTCSIIETGFTITIGEGQPIITCNDKAHHVVATKTNVVKSTCGPCNTTSPI